MKFGDGSFDKTSMRVIGWQHSIVGWGGNTTAEIIDVNPMFGENVIDFIKVIEDTSRIEGPSGIVNDKPPNGFEPILELDELVITLKDFRDSVVCRRKGQSELDWEIQRYECQGVLPVGVQIRSSVGLVIEDWMAKFVIESVKFAHVFCAIVEAFFFLDTVAVFGVDPGWGTDRIRDKGFMFETCLACLVGFHDCHHEAIRIIFVSSGGLDTVGVVGQTANELDFLRIGVDDASRVDEREEFVAFVEEDELETTLSVGKGGNTEGIVGKGVHQDIVGDSGEGSTTGTSAESPFGKIDSRMGHTAGPRWARRGSGL